MDATGELPCACVGKLEIAKPEPVVGFLCGTLPVVADAGLSPFSQAALVPSTQTIQAPRYQMLPTETDLNTLPLLPNAPEKDFSATTKNGDSHIGSVPISHNLSRKCEALAVSGLAECDNDIDVVAPADILKQIFKIPYSKAKLSIAVQRVGDTLILNAGPDVEDSEMVFRRSSSQTRVADSSLFLNFAMHSVRAEACDCPPGHFAASENKPSSTILPGVYGHSEGSSRPSTASPLSRDPQFSDPDFESFAKKGTNSHSDYSQKRHCFYWGHKNEQTTRSRDTVKKTSHVGEKTRGPVQESEKCRRVGNNGFLRVLYWQFHNFRMLLGSDMLLFSNDKYVAVSLHLWDVSRQVTPLTWLEAWLDNVMASAPELAICYHRNGVVQGYELLKTDDIFLLKGITEDGAPAFHPQVVQQNGLAVMRFLQSNCKQDPGAYWLYKSAGEDVIQLFDLSVLPKSSSMDECERSCSSLDSLVHKCRREALFSLGTLLYRVAHRLSLSKAIDKRAKCAKFYKKCLDFLREQDHLIIRAYAHEQFARLILRCYQELDLTSESYLLESGVTVTDMEDESSVFSLGMFSSTGQEMTSHQESEDIVSANEALHIEDPIAEEFTPNPEAKLFLPRAVSSEAELTPSAGMMPSANVKDDLVLGHVSTLIPQVQTVVDPISSKLAAIHHVSQAIKALRWKRQLQNTEEDFLEPDIQNSDRSLPSNFSLCSCGEADCIEVCDIREWLGKSKLDLKLWKFVLLLGESYLALGEAYRDDGQLHQALRVVEIACSIYGSMPQYLENAQFISSMASSTPHPQQLGNETSLFLVDDTKQMGSNSSNSCFQTSQFTFNYLFWAKAWALVGDVFVEYHRAKGKDTMLQVGKSRSELRMSNEVVREVIRLKKKLARCEENCNNCSLINCSCQSDRANSGNSASSSGGGSLPLAYPRRYTRKINARTSSNSCSGGLQDRSHITTDSIPGLRSTNLSIINDNNEKSHAPFENSGKLDAKSMLYDRRDTGGSDTGKAENESERKNGGIFRFLKDLRSTDAEHNLTVAAECYDMALNAISDCEINYEEVQSLLKKKGWVFNELGRYRLERKDIENAELAFKDSIKAFKEVYDHVNIVLINFNMAHGRRALAEELVSSIENLMDNSMLKEAYGQFVKRAKVEYVKSLKYYEDAVTAFNAINKGADVQLKNELHTQHAHTYLRLGMLLAKEESLEVSFRNEFPQKLPMHSNEKFVERENNMSAGDAFRKALTIYESLGDLRKQEAAFAQFQLACFHRTSCLKLLDLYPNGNINSKNDIINRQKVKWYASLADKNWQKAIEFYGPKTHPTMFITILLEQSALCVSLWSSLQSNAVLEAALCHLLEARHVVGEADGDSQCSVDSEILGRFWSKLQAILKKMLTIVISGTANKLVGGVQPVPPLNREGDAKKLKEMYRMSLKQNSLDQMHTMHKLWVS